MKLLFRKAGFSVLLVIVLGISLYIFGMATIMDGEAAEKTQIILIRDWSKSIGGGGVGNQFLNPW